MRLGYKFSVLRASTDREIDAAFATISQQRISARSRLTGAPFFDTRREQIIALAARHGVPTIYHSREYCR